jgi:aspartyl-tRNA(Asn)/glutamyl-tRNA(Gln) amidotransferase subunit C
MKITEQAVMDVADLARLRFSPGERAGLAVQLNRILEYFDSLTDVETSGVEPLWHDQDASGALRPDEARSCLSLDKVFCNAPDREKNLFKVPRIIEG